MPTFTVKPITKKKEKEVADEILLQAVKKYKELQANIQFLQEDLKASRLIIENAVKHAPDFRIVTKDYKITYSEVSSERFDKEAAISKLGRKKLEPFLSISTYHQLRVS